MTKADMKKKVKEYLKEANDYINFAEQAAGIAVCADSMKDADYSLKKSVANSLMAIAYILAMKENFENFGDHLRGKKIDER